MSIILDGFPDGVLRQDGKEYMMGIDEAGRGPTLGPMVYGSAFCAVEDEERLKKMGFMDSKQLTEAKRDKLWAELQACGFIGWSIRVLEAKEISAGMLRRDNPYNLNAQSHDAAIELVRRVMDRGVNLRYLTVDTVGDPERYQAKLEGIFPTLSIIVAKKADSIYPIVSAGSICAKVPRDTLLSGWRFEDPAFTDVDWGCGYPSDVNTKRWMRDNLEPVFGWPNICRFSWGPATEVLEKNPQNHGAHVVRWADDAEDPAQVKQRQQMAQFLGAKKQKVDCHSFFASAMLEPVETW
jgi:ribonuclease H2 subunit A